MTLLIVCVILKNQNHAVFLLGCKSPNPITYKLAPDMWTVFLIKYYLNRTEYLQTK